MVKHLLVTVVGTSIGVVGLAQTLPSPLFAAITATDYLGETYTERPQGGASYVHFEGDAIRLLIAIGNPTTDDESLRLSVLSSGWVFDLRSTRNGEEVAIGFRLQDGTVGLPGEPPAQIDDPESVRLRPLERAVWKAELLDQLPPGQYRVSVVANGTDGQGRRLIWQTHSVRFEVRRRSAEYRSEVLYREALRQYLSDEPNHLDRAASGAESLLRIHPQSYAAYALLGRIAMDRGNANAAERFLDIAGDIIENDRDSLVRIFKMPHQIDEMKRAMRARRAKKLQ